MQVTQISNQSPDPSQSVLAQSLALSSFAALNRSITNLTFPRPHLFPSKWHNPKAACFALCRKLKAPVMPPQRRSWVGCARCKSFKKKCSEERPSCQRCQTAGVKCEYGVKLRWGGRPFNRSPFGDCLSQNEGNVQRLGMTLIRFIAQDTY